MGGYCVNATLDNSHPLDREALLSAYRVMTTIREFEERIHLEMALGEIPGFVHLYAGEEAVAAGVCCHLDDGDRITSTHRGHGHAIAKGCDVKAMMAELYGRKTGLCHGKGGSMHIADFDKGMLGANGIVGAGAPLACGIGLSAKIRGTKEVGVSFLGDGASNQGTFLESLNLAAVWKLPLIFVVENNGYGEATPATYHQAIDDVAKRADGFGMPGIVVDGRDFFAVREAVGHAIERARRGDGPSLVECKVDRFYGHFEGDAQAYRGSSEVENARGRDCIEQFVGRVTSAGLVELGHLAAIAQEVRTLIDDAVTEAKAAPWPDESDLLTDVYVSY
ncbi:MAG: thiamine pyrophosphate-dependent dehydrogenase E1 component subunit alpha [Thermoleophilia bacterium]|nr:thiamine pyrophosphate-dependent dehydrogenase E1 component subunit alpha [Thermoleophilia bacterium]